VIVVWDLGGVVCRFHPQRRLDALARLTGLPATTIHERIWSSGLDAAAERGELSPDVVWTCVLDALDHTATRDDVRRAWALAFEPNNAVLAIVDTLRVPSALFTNNGPIVDDILDEELAAVSRRFAHRFLSCRLGAAKPEPEAFARVAELLGDDLFLLDDSDANVTAARAQGWQAALIQAG